MFRFITLLAAIVGAAAFAPSARVASRSSALKMSYADEVRRRKLLFSLA
jgi:hypothetical protein